MENQLFCVLNNERGKYGNVVVLWLFFHLETETKDRCPAAEGTAVYISCDEVNTFLPQRCLHQIFLLYIFFPQKEKHQSEHADREHICNLTQAAATNHNCVQLQAA